MTRLTMDHDMPEPRLSVRADGTADLRHRSAQVPAWWQWLVAISQISVEHHYAAPWDRDADALQAFKAKAKG